MQRIAGTLEWLLLVAAVFFVISLAWSFKVSSEPLSLDYRRYTDPNGNPVRLDDRFLPKKVRPHTIMPKPRPFLWDKPDILPNRVYVEVVVG